MTTIFNFCGLLFRYLSFRILYFQYFVLQASSKLHYLCIQYHQVAHILWCKNVLRRWWLVTTGEAMMMSIWETKFHLNFHEIHCANARGRGKFFWRMPGGRALRTCHIPSNCLMWKLLLLSNAPGPGKNWQSNARGPGIFCVQMPGGVPGGMVRVGIERDIRLYLIRLKLC